MDQSSRPHVVRALGIVRSHANLVLFPSAVIGISYMSFLFPDQFGGFLAFGSVLATLIIYPLMYGRFIEVINGQVPAPWAQILRLHWWNFVLVSIALHIPLFVWLLISHSSGVSSAGLTYLLYGLINVAGIYVLPLVFLTRERFHCIPLGIKCLIGNFQFSTPLVFLSVLSIALSFSMGSSGAGSTLSHPSALGGLVVTLLTVAVDFVVFVAACLVLKEKLLKS